MKALYLVENNKVELKEVDKPKCKNNKDVLVKVEYSGICGSDYVRFFENQAKKYPLVLTHEFSGIVEESLSEKYLKGDKVAIVPLKPNFEDEQSKKGNYSLSKNYSFIGSREDGGLQQYIVIPEENLVKLDKEVDLKVGAFIEPMTVVLHGLNVVNLENLDVKRVALIGMGTIGLLALQILKAYNYNVTALDISEDKLKISRNLGADSVVNTTLQDDLEKVYDSFDLVIETSGANQSFYICNKLAGAKGNILYIGTPHKDLVFDFKTFELINRKELTVKGSWMNYSSSWPGIEWVKAVELMKANKIKVEPLIGKTTTLYDFENILDDYRNRRIDGKIFVRVGE